MAEEAKDALKKLALKLIKASDPKTVVESVALLKLADARTLLNELRKKRKKCEVVANGLILFYDAVESSHVATNVVQAICHHGDHRHFSFMLRVVRDLATQPRTRNQSCAIQSAIRGAGYLGMPDDAEALFQAGIPWNPRPNISERELSHEFARSATLMLVKRDGLGAKDLGDDYLYRVRGYSGLCGAGPDGLIADVKQSLATAIGNKWDQCNSIVKELDHRFRIAREANALIAMSWHPGYCDPPRSTSEIEFEEKLKKEPSIQFCEICGVRMNYTTAYVYSKNGRCPRCLFLGLKTWLVDVKRLSPTLWQLPPKNSPVSCEKSLVGTAMYEGKKWDPSTIRAYDQQIQRLRDFGPSANFWHNLLVTHTSGDMRDTLKIQGKHRHVTVPLTTDPGNPGGLLPRVLFILWEGEIALANERDALWINEEATVRIVSDLLCERALKQWTSDWLVNDATGSKMYVDGYFPKHSIAVEHQGRQHYEPVDFFGGEESFQELKRRDELKRQLLEEHGVAVLYIRYDEVDREKIESKLKVLQASASTTHGSEN